MPCVLFLASFGDLAANPAVSVNVVWCRWHGSVERAGCKDAEDGLLGHAGDSLCSRVVRRLVSPWVCRRAFPVSSTCCIEQDLAPLGTRTPAPSQ